MNYSFNFKSQINICFVVDIKGHVFNKNDTKSPSLGRSYPDIDRLCDKHSSLRKKNKSMQSIVNKCSLVTRKTVQFACWPQFILWSELSPPKSMKPSKFNWHFKTRHSNYKYWKSDVCCCLQFAKCHFPAQPIVNRFVNHGHINTCLCLILKTFDLLLHNKQFWRCAGLPKC